MKLNYFFEFLGKFCAVILAFFAPIAISFYIIISMVIADTLLTLIANKKENIKYDEQKFDLLFYKISTYSIALIIVHAVSLYFGFDATLVTKTLVSFIVVKELISSDKSIEKILGFSLFKFLIKKLQDVIKK